MKTIRIIFKSIALIVILTVALASHVKAQSAPQFTGIAATAENAIRLTWSSVSHEVYEIDEADTLGTNFDGTTAWNALYTDYPSQGTNTFWMDMGNYVVIPGIVRPKNSSQRFYRIVDLGPDGTSDEPTVFISSATNNSTFSGEAIISVTASTDQAGISTKLYVDGQEMNPSFSTTNYTDGPTNFVLDTYAINSCEWLNGAHTIFATAECVSGFEGPNNTPSIATGHAVSPFVPVTFSNLVTGISFSQVFFDPASGQTQQVSAIFAANVNWTIYVQDVNSNIVRTATGSGGSMQFSWDGTGNGGIILPPGIYYYVISATTNGLLLPSGISEGGSGSADIASTFSSLSLHSASINSIASVEFPMPPLPPGFNDEESETITVAMPNKMARALSLTATTSFGPSSPAALSSSVPSQTTPQVPQRPPIAPVRGVSGTFGIAYDTYSINGTNGIGILPPLDGSGSGLHIKIQGSTAEGNLPWMKSHKPEADNFVAAMTGGSWSPGFVKSDNQFAIADLKGSGSMFNQVNIGVLMLHGAFGTSPDGGASFFL